jgi:hypothetical protein
MQKEGSQLMDDILNKLIHSPAYSFLYKEKFLGNNIILLGYIKTKNSKYALRGITLGENDDIIGLKSNQTLEYHDKETDTIIYSLSSFYDNLLSYNIDCLKLFASTEFIYMNDIGKTVFNSRYWNVFSTFYKESSYILINNIKDLINNICYLIDTNDISKIDHYLELIEDNLNIITNYNDNSTFYNTSDSKVKEIINKKNTDEVLKYIDILIDTLDYYFTTSSTNIYVYINNIVKNINKEKILNDYKSDFIEKIFLDNTQKEVA